MNVHQIDNSSDLRNTIGLIRAGSEVTLTIVRDGETQRLVMQLGDDRPRLRERITVGGFLEGAEFEELQPGMEGYGEVDGVAVSRVQPGSAAARVGLRPGDIIIAVDRAPVSSVEEFARAVDNAGAVLAMNVYRDGTEFLVTVR